MRDADSAREFERALVRFNSHVLGITAGLVAGGSVFVATAVLVLRGDVNPGGMLGMLSLFFPGYSVSLLGACVGAAWAGLFSYLLGAVFARAYGPWLLHRVHEGDDPGAEGDLLRGQVARLSPLPVAVTAGGLGAVGLFVVHHWIALRAEAGDPALHYLGLLHNYLPGYRIDFAGSLVGAAWVFVYATAGVGTVAILYNAVVRLRSRA